MNNTNTVVNKLYQPNDRLGVALMGAKKWNRLKMNVANTSRNYAARGYTPGVIRKTYASPIASQLMGFNDAAGVALLGSTWSNLKDTVTSTTHTALNIGKQIPITSGLVDTLRDVGSYFKWGSKASSETDSAIDAAAKAIKANKIKTALILGGVGVGAAFLIYYMGKKK